MEDKKEYIEVEVIKNKKESGGFSRKAFNYGSNFGKEKIRENLNDLKRGLYWKVFLAFLPHILGILLFFILIFGIIFLLFAHPFDYIIAILFLYFIIKQIWKLNKFLK